MAQNNIPFMSSRVMFTVLLLVYMLK